MSALLASFNFYGPALAIFIAGLTMAGIVLLIVALTARRILTGVLVGSLAWMGIAALVFGASQGDLAELLLWFCTPMAGLAGGILGGASAFFGRKRRRALDRNSHAR